MVNSLGRPINGWDRVSGDLRGEANSVSQVDGVSDMAPACWLCLFVGKRFTTVTIAADCLSVWEKLFPSTHLDATHFSSSLYASGAFQDATLLQELRGSVSE